MRCRASLAGSGAIRAHCIRRFSKAGLSKEAFVATGVVSAVIVDAMRITVYETSMLADHFAQSKTMLAPVAVASLAAFMGAFVATLQKITLRGVQLSVAVAMLIMVWHLLPAGVV